MPCTLYVFTTIAESRLPCNRGGAELWRAQTPFSNAGSASVVLPHEYCRLQGATSVIPPSSLPLSRGFCLRTEIMREIDFREKPAGLRGAEAQAMSKLR